MTGRGQLRRFETAVITGGARGLGAAFVDRLRAHGASVVVADVRAEGLEAFVAARRDDGGPPIHGVVCDVSDPEAVRALADAAFRHLGSVDLWVNNAGVAAAGATEDTEVSTWRRVIDIDLMGVVWGARAILPHFRSRGRGAMINVASAAALVCGPEMAAYNVAKKGVLGLTESLATELYGTGVTVTCVCPTFFATGLMETAEGDPALLRFAGKLMDKASTTADDVAAQALHDAIRGRIHSVPMADGLWIWRLRRWFPERASGLIGWVYARGKKRASRRHASRRAADA